MESRGHLAVAIETRRKALLLSQEELASRSGLSLTTIRDLEAGRREVMRASNRRALATGLGWTPDSVDRVSQGQEPMLSEPAPTLRPVGDPVVQQRLDDLERRLAELEGAFDAQRRLTAPRPTTSGA